MFSGVSLLEKRRLLECPVWWVGSHPPTPRRPNQAMASPTLWATVVLVVCTVALFLQTWLASTVNACSNSFTLLNNQMLKESCKVEKWNWYLKILFSVAFLKRNVWELLGVGKGRSSMLSLGRERKWRLHSAVDVRWRAPVDVKSNLWWREQAKCNLLKVTNGCDAKCSKCMHYCFT